MFGFYMECYTGLKWVKTKYLLPQILSLVNQNISKEVLLTGPKIQAKIPIHSGENMTAILLQNATKVYYKIRQVFTTGCYTFIAKCGSYYKLRRFYYKMLQLLQNATFITNCDSTYNLHEDYLQSFKTRLSN